MADDRAEQMALPLGDSGGTSSRPGVIISASRRTDLPGFYPHEMVSRVRSRLDRLGDDLYGLVVWTRHPAALLVEPLRSLLEDDIQNAVVNLTITGLGGSSLEPGVPSTDDAVAPLPELIGLLRSQPQRIRWRFDPLIFGRNGLDQFERIGERLAALGVPTVTFSFPSSMSLKGSLLPQYASAGIERWPSLAAKTGFAAGLVARARDLDIRPLACCQPKIIERVEGVEPAQCVPLDVLEALHPSSRCFPKQKDRTQRRHCTCPPSLDIGDYATDRCGSGCAYCYSKAGGP